MKNKKNFIITTMCLAIVLNFSSCSKIGKDKTTSTLPIKVSVETLQTTTTTTASPKVELEALKAYQKTDNYFFSMENNVDDTIDLSLVCVNGNWLSIKEMNLSNFIRGVGVKKSSWSTIENEDEHLYFVGNGYGFVENNTETFDYGRNEMMTVDDPTAFKGTLLGIECCVDSEVVEIVEDNEMQKYNIKAVMSSIENTKDDFEILYYNGVKTGMTRNEVINLLGEGIVENEVSAAPALVTTTMSTTEPTTTTVPAVTTSNLETQTSLSESVIPETVASANAEAVATIESEIIDKNDISEKKKNETNETSTTVPETEITTTTTVDPYERYTAKMIFKNTKNTLVIIFNNGKVSQIYLYNNAPELATEKPVVNE